MYNRPIETTVSVLGFVVYLRYFVTVQNAVNWELHPLWYQDENMEEPSRGIELLETCLRVHWDASIQEQLYIEFEERMYEQEAKLAAQAQKQDIPF